MNTLPLQFKDIKEAADRLKGHAVRTPLLESEFVNEKLGGRLLVKAECLQRTGSFKFRGAFNTISQLSEIDKSNGIIAFSSGNHAQGVALAAKLFGIPATIIMPADTPQIKIDNTKAYGAKVIFYDRFNEDREAICEPLIAKHGYKLIHPFDNYQIMAGQGTVGLEIAEQSKEKGISVDAALICCGGGGLIAGSATALYKTSPQTKIYAVEPEGFDDTVRSLETRKRQTNIPGARSICDAIVTPSPGELTFPINEKLLSGGLVVTDEQVKEAMRTAFSRFKLVIEPGGAVSLAAALSGVFDCRDKTVVVVSTGGNVDPDLYQKVISEV